MDAEVFVGTAIALQDAVDGEDDVCSGCAWGDSVVGVELKLSRGLGVGSADGSLAGSMCGSLLGSTVSRPHPVAG